MFILRKNLRTPVFLIAVVLPLLIVHVTSSGHAADTGAESSSKNKILSPEELVRIIQAHAKWQKVYENRFKSDEAINDNRRADLRGADLRKARLDNTDLRGADLRDVKLMDVYLGDTDLSGSDLSGADLSRANLVNARMIGTDLGGADLSSATLWNADLSGANLYGANLSKTDARWADLNRAIFEPNSLPDVDKIAFAQNLEKMVYRESQQELKKLRNLFKENGFFAEERKVTYAIKHHGTMSALESGKYDLAAFESAIYYIAFDLTTQWGMAPWRALMLLILLVFFFTMPYAIAIRQQAGSEIEHCVYRKWSDDCMLPGNKAKEAKGTPEILHVDCWRTAICFGWYFSFLSAFSIDWRGLDVNNWIQRLQSKEYTLRANGWVRTVSGIQALISVYLIAIWLLTYSSRPFE